MSQADGHLPDHPAIDLLRKLVRRASVTPDDAGCQQLIADRLRASGFRCEHMPFGDVSNLWARRGDTGPVLCFAGHTDVVPPGPLQDWQTDPFEPVIKDGLMYGRGSADMKSGLAAMVVAVEQFVEANPDHAGSLALLITSDEEGRARDGTLKVVESLTARGDNIDWCVIGEPSSLDELGDVVRIGRRGSLSATLQINGTQGHVAYPHLANNPIRHFAPILDELHNIEWDRGNEYFPPTSFQVVSIQSDSGAPNITPSELSTTFNFRYSTEWTHESLISKVTELLDGHGIDYKLNWHLSGEPFLTAPGKLVDAVSNAVREQSGKNPELSTGGGTSDGRFIASASTDVVELGPVHASIHKVDEHVRVDDVPKLASMYQRIMELLLLT